VPGQQDDGAGDDGDLQRGRDRRPAGPRHLRDGHLRGAAADDHAAERPVPLQHREAPDEQRDGGEVGQIADHGADRSAREAAVGHPRHRQPAAEGAQQEHHDKEHGHCDHFVPPVARTSIAHFRVGASRSRLHSKVARPAGPCAPDGCVRRAKKRRNAQRNAKTRSLVRARSDPARAHHDRQRQGEQQVAGERGPGQRNEAEERRLAGEQVRHDVEREDPQADAVGKRRQPPRQRREDRPLQRPRDEQVAQRIEDDADHGVDQLGDRPALQAEHALDQGRRFERAADEERGDAARPDLPDEVGGDAGEDRGDEGGGGQGGEGARLGMEGRRCAVGRHRADSSGLDDGVAVARSDGNARRRTVRNTTRRAGP